jgi:phosphinothricin acetyltransferase
MVRPCFEQDIQWVQLIYAHHVMTGAGTFEIKPPSLEDMRGRWTEIVSKGWPFLVACPAHDPSRIFGYAYARPFRDREAYAYTFEDSVYVAPGQTGKGVGTRLLTRLLATLTEDGIRQVVAVIGDSANQGSIALHKRCGFRPAGQLTNVGAKFGRWFDVVLMQRTLPVRAAAGQAPAEE